MRLQAVRLRSLPVGALALSLLFIGSWITASACGDSGSSGGAPLGGSTTGVSGTGSTGGSSSTTSSSTTGGATSTTTGTSSGNPEGGRFITMPSVPPDSAVEAGPDCVNLECQQTGCVRGACTQKPCAAGATTTVSGTVYDPAGRVPIYNVIVYVPNNTPPAFLPGASCDKCSSTAINPVTAALTDTKGQFVLDDVPVGTNIPLVMQIGKWRRQITIPTVTACADTPLTDATQTRLPKNKSEGDIPLIAISTGGADTMECLPLRMGIDAAEFTTEAGDGRIHLYAGHDNGTKDIPTKRFDTTLNAGATFSPSTALWNTVDTLSKYDIVVMSCEGYLSGANDADKSVAARQALYDYESLGGRVFASHYHHFWFSQGPAPVPLVATWSEQNAPPDPITGNINTTFPKGQAMADWLVNVGASTTPGQLAIHQGKDNANAVDPARATPWITFDNPNVTAPALMSTVEFFSFNAPLDVPEDMQCGRAVFNDLHVSVTTGDKSNTPFPTGCSMGELSEQEKALEFMLFDLSSCIRKDSQPPKPPGRVN